MPCHPAQSHAQNIFPFSNQRIQIKQLASLQSYERGEDYFNDGAIHNPTIQDHHLWSECYGSDLYYPSAVLDNNGIKSSSCTCPYDWGDICTHQVALLLTYIHKRSHIRIIPPLQQLLAKQTSKDLIALIERMVHRHPDLIEIINSSPSTSGSFHS